MLVGQVLPDLLKVTPVTWVHLSWRVAVALMLFFHADLTTTTSIITTISCLCQIASCMVGMQLHIVLDVEFSTA